MKELKRWYQYVNGEPAMCIAPLFVRVRKNAFVICLSAAHRYTDPEYMLRQCVRIVELFDLGTISKERLARIAAFIEDGFDELVKMRPEPREAPKVIGEGEAWAGGGRMSFEVLDTMLPGCPN